MLVNISHNISLKPDRQSKSQKSYKIPDALKNEVVRQIKEFVSLGFIEYFESECAHPVPVVYLARKIHQ